MNMLQAAVNALNAHCKHVSEPVKVHLFESYCLLILLYGLDCVKLSSQQTMYAGIMLTEKCVIISRLSRSNQ